MSGTCKLVEVHIVYICTVLSSPEITFNSNYNFRSKPKSCLVKDKINNAHSLTASAGIVLCVEFNPQIEIHASLVVYLVIFSVCIRLIKV
jgi:hypothetical protein